MAQAHGFFTRIPACGAAVMLLAMAAALGGCLGEKLAGSTSTGNTGKGTISGRVLNAKGEGVANARVRVVSVDHNPGPGGTGAGEVADVVLTAADGTFRTDSLADGLYNLLDEKAGQLSFRDSVAVDGDSAAVAGDDVLRPPGSLAGVVRLQPGHDSRTVFLILLGTTTVAFPMDSVGNFRLANMAEGEYRLRILSTLDAYKPLDTLVTIVSGVQGILRDTLRPAYKHPPGEIPEVESLQVAYDSARIAATLTWRKADPAVAASYRVYRKHRDSAFVRLNQAALAETVFVDDWTSGLLPGNHYEYAVTVVDSRDDEGRKSEGVPINPGVRYRIDLRVPGADCAMVCEFDVDAAGDVYISESSGTVVRYGFQGGISKWKDPISDAYGSRQIAADAAGGSVYILYYQPLRLAKLDSAGKTLWLRTLGFDPGYGFTLHKGGDSLYLWRNEENAMIMTFLDLNGGILGQDTLMEFLPPASMMFPVEYKSGVGFYRKTTNGISLLDRDGRILADWNPVSRGYMVVDLERDAEGRWFLSWDSGVVDVYSPDRVLLGTILTGQSGNRLKFRSGGMYLVTLEPSVHQFQLSRIEPGF